MKMAAHILLVALMTMGCSRDGSGKIASADPVKPIRVLYNGAISDDAYTYSFDDLRRLDTTSWEPRGKGVEVGGALRQQNSYYYFFPNVPEARKGEIKSAIKLGPLHVRWLEGNQIPNSMLNRIVVLVGYWHHTPVSTESFDVYALTGYSPEFQYPDPRYLYHSPVFR